jgi:hypothetical protein
VGLLLGGVLTEYVSWRWTLYVNLVFAAVAIAGALVYLRSSRPRMDWPGTVLASAGLFLIVFGFSHAETAGWTAVLTAGSLAAGLLLLVAFVLAERQVSHPLLPLRVILDRTRGGAYVAVGLAGISIFGVFLFLTYYLQVVKDYSPLTCGLLFLPFVGCILVSSNVSSIVTLPRFGPRVLIGDRGHPRLHPRLRCVSRAARIRRDPRGRPAAIPAPAYRAQEHRRRPRAAAGRTAVPASRSAARR